MRDLLNALLFSSDPLISSLSQCIGKRSNKEPLIKEVLQLLQEPELVRTLLPTNDDSDDSDIEY